MKSIIYGVLGKIAVLVIAALILPRYFFVADINTLVCLALIFLVAETSGMVMFVILSIMTEYIDSGTSKSFAWVTLILTALSFIWLAFPYVPALYIACHKLAGFAINGKLAFISICFVMFIVHSCGNNNNDD